MNMSRTTIRLTIAGFLALAAAVLVFTWVNQRSGPSASKDEGLARKSASPDPSHESSQTSPTADAKGKRSGSKLTPDLARSQKEQFFSRNPNAGERIKFACDLIQGLCQNGFSEEAFHLLDTNYGMVRSNEIATLFKFADLPNSELLRRIEEISVYTGNKEDALRGYVGRFKLDELVDSISDPEFQATLLKGERLRSSALSFSLAMALSRFGGEGNPQFSQTARDLIGKGYLKPFDFVKISTESSSSGDPFERWRRIQEVIPAGTLTNGSPTSSGNPGQSLVSQMVLGDGPRTLNTLLEVEDYASVNHAISQWTHSDPSGATRWYESNSSQLTPNQNNAVSSAFASTALSSAEFDVARAWAERVQDPKSKEDLLKKIAETEEKRLADLAAMEKRKQEEAKKQGGEIPDAGIRRH